MHLHYLDPYEPRNSLVHALDARVKLALAVAFILTVALIPVGGWAFYGLLFAIDLSVIVLSELGVGRVLRRSALAIPFILAAAPLLFTAGPPALLTLPIFGGIPISAAGATRFATITLKSWLSVQMAIVLASATSFPDLLRAMRALRVPRLFVATFGLMWRYLFVLADEAQRMLRARAARSGVSDPAAGVRTGGSLGWRARVAGGMAGSLFLRAIERGDRIYLAMSSRGYDGEMRSFPLAPVPRAQRIVLFAGLAAFVTLLAVSALF